jgi:hypothetical protein
LSSVHSLVRALRYRLRVPASTPAKLASEVFTGRAITFKLFPLGRTKIERSQLYLGASLRFCTAAGLLHHIFAISYKSERSRDLNYEHLCCVRKKMCSLTNADLIVNPRDVILKIASAAICDSDCIFYNGLMPTMENGDVLS